MDFLGYFGFLNNSQGIATDALQQVCNLRVIGLVLCILINLSARLLEPELETKELICLILLFFDLLQKLKLRCLDSLSITQGLSLF